MKKNKVLIVEDDVLIAEFLNDILIDENISFNQIAHTINDAKRGLKDFQPNIILLDINIDGHGTGLQIAELNKHAAVIYITAQEDAVTLKKAIATHPVSYLTKPVKKKDVLAAVQLASEKLKTDFIFVKDGAKEIKLFFDDIYYAKSDGNYIDVYTTTNKLALRNTLDNFLKELNRDNFCKPHRSYIINKDYISQKSSSFVIINNNKIPLSRKYTLSV